MQVKSDCYSSTSIVNDFLHVYVTGTSIVNDFLHIYITVGIILGWSIIHWII